MPTGNTVKSKFAFLLALKYEDCMVTRIGKAYAFLTFQRASARPRSRILTKAVGGKGKTGHKKTRSEERVSGMRRLPLLDYCAFTI